MSGTSYFIPNVPSDYTITWETSPRVSRTSPQGANPCVFKASGSGSSEWIEATVADECGNVVELDRRNVSTVWPSGVWVQNGQPHPLYTVNFVNYGSWIQAELACPTLNGSNWVMTSGSGINWNQSFYAGYSYLNLYLNTSNSYGDFRVNLYTDNCGTISPTYHFVPGYMYAFSMSPNPASDEVVISRIDAEQVFEQNVLKPKKEKYKEKVIANLDLGENSFKDIKFRMKEPEEYTIRLFNEKQGLIKLIKTKNEKQEIDLRHLPSGTYFLHIENDYVLYQEQLIIRR